ncbi:uncharacterized protein [Apostichopus japonicus]|uniref:uncharacterized protein isoform X2 n=1 Tax=Stichopus japonicus TaxID=307972 RepID=UPI003AB8A7CF
MCASKYTLTVRLTRKCSSSEKRRLLTDKAPQDCCCGSCQENIYLEVGKQGLVSCHFENFDVIGWIHGTGDVTSTSPFIYMEGSQIYGRGYVSRDYDMHPNGSLIINEVKLENEFNYTVLLVPKPAGANEYFKAPVKVYVPPDPWHPVVNGLTNQQQVVLHGIGSGSITCSMAGVRPKVHLEWVSSPDEITLDGTPTVTNNSDGTYDVSLNSNFRVLSGAMGNVIFMCRATGHKADNFTSETEVYLLNQDLQPVVNGLYNQKHIILDVNRGGEVSCTSHRVTENDSLELSIIPPLSSDEISQETTSSRSNNKDGTFNIKCSLHFGFLSQSMEQVTLECRVFDRTTNTSLDVTTVELFLPEYQESDCTSQWSPGLNTLILLCMNVSGYDSSVSRP